MTDDTLISELHDAIGDIIADERRQWQRDRDLVEAQVRAMLSDARAQLAEMRAGFEAMARQRLDDAVAAIHARLECVRDGTPGTPGEKGERGEPGEQGHVGEQGPPGVNGEPGSKGDKGDAGEQGPQGEQGPAGAAGPAGAGGDKGDQGERGEKGEAGQPGQDGEPGAPGAAGPAGPIGATGPVGPQGEPGQPGANGPQGPQGECGAIGERGPEGPPGKLPIVKEWTERVHYEGDVVVHRGALWQADCDTGRAPGGRDWTCLARAGRDGAAINPRGLHQADGDYARLDLVMLNGSSFLALKDHPGTCPGEDWQLLCGVGRAGKPGRDGESGRAGPAGPKGEPGPPGARIVKWRMDRAGYRAIALMSDGDEVPLSLRELFEQFNSETR